MSKLIPWSLHNGAGPFVQFYSNSLAPSHMKTLLWQLHEKVLGQFADGEVDSSVESVSY